MIEDIVFVPVQSRRSAKERIEKIRADSKSIQNKETAERVSVQSISIESSIRKRVILNPRPQGCVDELDEVVGI